MSGKHNFIVYAIDNTEDATFKDQCKQLLKREMAQHQIYQLCTKTHKQEHALAIGSADSTDNSLHVKNVFTVSNISKPEDMKNALCQLEFSEYKDTEVANLLTVAADMAINEPTKGSRKIILVSKNLQKSTRIPPIIEKLAQVQIDLVVVSDLGDTFFHGLPVNSMDDYLKLSLKRKTPNAMKQKYKLYLNNRDGSTAFDIYGKFSPRISKIDTLFSSAACNKSSQKIGKTSARFGEVWGGKRHKTEANRALLRSKRNGQVKHEWL